MVSSKSATADLGAGGATWYLPIVGGQSVSSATESNVQARFRFVAGIATTGWMSLLNFRVKVNGTTAASTLTLRKNNSDTAVTLSIAGGATGHFFDASHNEAAIAQNDMVNLKLLLGAGGSSFIYTSHAILFGIDGTSICEYSTWDTANGFNDDGSDYFFAINGLGGVTSVQSEEEYKVLFPCRFTDLFCRIGANTRDAGAQITFLQNGGGFGTMLIAAGGTGFFDNKGAGATDLAVGDLVCITMHLLTGTGAVGPSLMVGCEINAPNQEAFHFVGCDNGGVAQAFAAGTQTYFSIGGSNRGSTTEADMQQWAGFAGHLLGLQVRVNANSLSNGSTFGTRKNATTGGMTLAISPGATGLFQDLSGRDDVTFTDSVNYLLITGAGTGTIRLGPYGCAAFYDAHPQIKNQLSRARLMHPVYRM